MTTATEHLDIPVAKIAAHPRNPRRAVGDVTELAASIKEQGLLQDLVVAPWPTDTDVKAPRGAQYVLIAGHRRHAALKKAGLKTASAKVRLDLDTTPTQLEAMLVENLQRTDLTPVEEAHAYQELLDLGINAAGIAKRTGLTQKRVRERVKLTRIPEAVQDLAHTGQITLGDALIFDEFRGDEKALDELAAAAGTDNFRFAVNQLRSRREEAKALAERCDRIREHLGAAQWDSPAELDNAEGVDEWAYATGLPGVYWYEYAKPDDVDAKAAEIHGSCPGHGFLLTGDRWTPIRYVCTMPDLHRTTTTDDTDTTSSGGYTPPPETPQEAAEREAHEQLKRDLAAAQTTRLEYARTILNASPSQALAREALIRHLIVGDESGESYTAAHPSVYETLQQHILPTLAPVPPDTPHGATEAFRVDELYRVLGSLDTPQLAVLIDLVNHYTAEDDLTVPPTRWSNPWARDEYGARWILRLQDVYGYRPSDFELGQLTAAASDDEEGDDQ